MPESSAMLTRAGLPRPPRGPCRARSGERLAVLRRQLTSSGSASQPRAATGPPEQALELAALVLVVGREQQLTGPPPRRAHSAVAAPPSVARSPRLDRAQPLDPAGGERQQLVEMGPRQRRALGRRLHLHQPALAGHDDVGVDLGGRVLGVVEVEQRPPADDAAGDRRDRAGQRRALEPPLGLQARAGQREGHVGAGDRSAAGAAVGLQHVAVEVDRCVRRAP